LHFRVAPTYARRSCAQQPIGPPIGDRNMQKQEFDKEIGYLCMNFGLTKEKVAVDYYLKATTKLLTFHYLSSVTCLLSLSPLRPGKATGLISRTSPVRASPRIYTWQPITHIRCTRSATVERRANGSRERSHPPTFWLAYSARRRRGASDRASPSRLAHSGHPLCPVALRKSDGEVWMDGSRWRGKKRHSPVCKKSGGQTNSSAPV
jgi:hypothetical protein